MLPAILLVISFEMVSLRDPLNGFNVDLPRLGIKRLRIESFGVSSFFFAARPYDAGEHGRHWLFHVGAALGTGGSRQVI